MFGQVKLLLVGFFFTAVCCKATEGNKVVDSASDVVDDLYDGCNKEAMDKFIHSGLLKRELNKSQGFQKAWDTNTQCSTLIPGGLREHTAALSALLDGDVDFLHKVNNAVETLGVNLTTYENDFHFKSLHFLLMDAMKLLKPNNCKTVYVLLDEMPTQKVGSAVRLAGFTVADLDIYGLQDFADGIVLKMESCFFVNLGDQTCKTNIDSVLISPGEVFTLQDVGTKKDADDEEYTEVFLKHLTLNSTHNCYMFSRSTSSPPSQAAGLIPLVPLLVLLSLWSLSI